MFDMRYNCQCMACCICETLKVCTDFDSYETLLLNVGLVFAAVVAASSFQNEIVKI